MNKHLLSLFSALTLCVGQVFAERVSEADAALVANNFMNVSSSSTAKKATRSKRMVLKKSTAAEEPQYYIYENADGEGWVMVAANDIARPIIAYSDEGSFRTDNQPENLKHWLGRYNAQIKQAEEDGVSATEEVTQEWSRLRKGGNIRKGTPVVAALIKTKWDQDAPYWKYCPKKNGTQQTLTGCVATAMAQVMYYWKWPEKGTGSYSYSTQTLGLSCSADFANTTYDWDNMLEKYTQYYNEGSSSPTSTSSGNTAQQDAVATLMYHCGVAVAMDYNVSSAGGSGAQTIRPNASYSTAKCAQNALYQNFGYKSTTVKGYYRPGGSGYSVVSDANWHNYLKTELDAARPIMYAGGGYEDINDDDTYYGHSFICDGYDDTTPTRKYHFNWGWSGYCDGYYDIENLVPGTGGSGAGQGEYLYDHDIIIGIIPDKPDVTITWSVQGVTSTTTQTTGTLVLPATTPSDCSGTGGKKFVGWTAQSTITGGTRPTDLFTSGSGITVTENKTYYAVYATASEGGGGGSSTGSKTFTFSSIASANNWENGVAYTSVVDAPVTITASGGGNNGKWYTSGGGSWRMYSGGTVTIAVTSGSVTSVTSSPSCSFTISNGEATFSPSARTDFTSITVNYSASGGSGTSYSEYSLICGTPCSNTPEMSFSPATVNKTTADDSFTKVVSMSGNGSGQTAKYSSSDETVATVNNSGVVTLKGKVGSTTITASVEASGTYCAASASYTLNVTAAPINVTLYYNGTSASLTNQTNPYTLPTGAPYNTAMCSGDWTFAGWYGSAYTKSETEPTYITELTATGSAYAVYTTTETSGGGGSSTGSKTFTFSSIASANSWENGVAYTSVVDAPVTITASGGGNNGKWYTSGGGSWRMYSGGTVTIAVTSGSVTSVTSSPSCDFTISNGEATFSPSARTDFTEITVAYSVGGGGSSTTYYATTPECVTPCSNTPEMSFTNTTVDETTDDVTYTQAVTITGKGSGQTVDYSSSDETVATVDNSGVVALKGKVGSTTITASVLADGDYCAASASYTLNVTAAPINVTLYYNSTSASLTNQTSPYTLPTNAPYNTAMCDGNWTFAGWYGSEYTKSETEPTYITELTATGSAYAVYTTTETSGGGGSSTGSKTFTFSSIASANSWTNGTAYTEVEDSPVTITAEGGGNNGKWYTSGGGSWRMYSGGTVSIAVTSGSVTSVTSSPTCSFSISEGVATFSPSDRTDFTEITVAYSVGGGGSSTTYYATTPECPTTVTVTFYKNDGTDASTSQTIPYNTSTALTANSFSRTGYTFQGWATSATGTKAYDDGASVTLTSNTPLYAVWQKNSHDVTFNPSPTGATVTINSSSTSPKSVEYGETVTIAITPDAAYEISSVTATGVEVSGSGNTRTFTMPDADVTVTVTMAIKTTYAIRFFNNGTQVGTTQNLYADQTATPPTDPTACEGYTFYGWWTEALATTNTEAHKVTDFTVSGAQDYYAVYSHSEGSGESTTINAGDFSSVGDGGNIGTKSISGIIFTGDRNTHATLEPKYYSGSPSTIRCYVGNKLTISASSISQIDFTYDGSYDGGNINVSAGGWESTPTTNWDQTWKGSADEVVFTIGGTAQWRITAMKITTGGGGTTYYTTSPDCVECLTKVTLTKGEESNGTFTLNKADGVYNNCTSNFVVTVSNITPASGYYCTGVTASGDHNEVTGPDGSGNYTVTYEKGNAVTSTITANFAPNPKYTVTWSMDGDISTTAEYEAGQAIVFPTSATGCDGRTFMGWVSEAITTPQDNAPTYVTSATMGTSNLIYYAVYAEEDDSGSGSATYSKATSIAAGDKVIFVCEGATTEMSGISTSSTKYGLGTDYSTAPAGLFVFDVEAGTSAGTFAFKNANKYLYWGSGNTLNLYNTTAEANNSWSVSINSSGNATILNASNTDRQLVWNNGSPRFACYENPTIGTSYYIIQIYKQSGGTSYTGYTTSCGASVNAKNIGWITATKRQKVKRVINVSAKGFAEATTLTATSGNAQFKVTLGASAVPSGAAGLSTTLTVEYAPTDFGTKDEDVEITLTAGDQSKTITVSGRSLPEEFLLITKKTSTSTWYALPANMTGGANEYDGIAVSPNDPTTPTAVAVSSSTLIYNMASVASSRYADNGHLVRLVGNGNKCLWGSKATNATKVNIQNYATLGESNGDYYEWDLKTTDGVHYFVESPCNAEYASGRRLAYGSKFGMYKEGTVFYIVSAGCSSHPEDVNISPRRVDATFSWVSNASSMVIDLYTNDGMTEGHLSSTATSSPYVFTGLAESTNYWYRLTPDGSIDCAVTGTFKTSGPIIDIVEWQENAVVLFIDKGDINPKIIIDGQEEHGSITGGDGNATELFFAKYFEGAGSMKLVSIFNGTKNDINLTNYSIYVKMRGATSWAPSNDVNLDLGTLGSIKAGQEIIFFSRPLGTETDLANCSNDFLTGKVSTSSSADSNPRWVECDGETFQKINFNGNDPILLKKNGTLIDVIGSEEGNAPTATNCLYGDSEKGWGGTVRNMDKGKSPSDPAFDAFYDVSSKTPATTADSIAILNGFGINLTDDEIPLTTARCIFFRDKRVTCGDSAVAMNGSTFVTFSNHDEFTSEWYGRSVCMNAAAKTAAGVSNDAQATCNSYQDIANMNYNEYYIDWTNINAGTELDQFTHNPETKEYTITIDNMRQHACLNLRFQLVQGEEVLTEASQQVPIVVTGNVDTNDDLFSALVVDKTSGNPSYSHSKDRCKTCDVVVLGTATLTKGPDTDPKDVPEIGNLKVYPGGKLIVPDETNYTVNSLALRRQEDNLSIADIKGGLTIGTANSTFLDIRIDPTNWHYFTLPYDCNVSDIRFVNDDVTIPVIGTDFLISAYDGEHRAATQATSWRDLTSTDVLYKGVGYIIGLPGSGKVQREFRFPMSNDVIAEEKASEGKQTGIFHAWGGDKSDTELRPNHKGWNLIGNPYLTYYETKLQDPLPTGELIHDPDEDPWLGHYVRNTDGVRYIVVPVDNGWSEYEQVAIFNYHMAPFTSYFVQLGGDPAADLTITYEYGQSGKMNIIRRQPAEYEEDNHEVWFGITLANEKAEQDETALLISDKFTDDYDIMNDLVKMRGTYYKYYTKPVLASRNAADELAFNALPDNSAKAGVPLNFYAASQGQYTIALDGRYSLEEIKDAQLFDSELNTWHNLMAGDYGFTAKKGDNTTRFMLYVTVERKQPQVPTEINNISGKLTLTTADRTLILSGLREDADIYVYDMSGKLIAADRHFANGDNSVWRTTVSTQGVYFVRVKTGTEQQTLNTIVY